MRPLDPFTSRKLQEARTAARWNGALLAIASLLILVLGLGKASTTSDVLFTFLGFGILLVGGLAARRWGRGELKSPPTPEQR